MILRFSYSMLSAWAMGDTDRALAAFFRRPYISDDPEAEKRLELGKKFHESWEAETILTGCQPTIFGGEKLHNPKLELATKKEVMILPWLQFVGVLDLQDMPLITDHKASKNNATYWANTKQSACYHVLYPNAKMFRFNVRNPCLPLSHPDAVSVSFVHLTDKTLEDGLNYIMTYATEMRNYLEQNNLIKKEN